MLGRIPIFPDLWKYVSFSFYLFSLVKVRVTTDSWALADDVTEGR